MSDGTLTLTDFLLARIAEDEAVANNVRPDELYQDRRGLGFGEEMGSPLIVVSSGRVLAECAAKRRIVEREADTLARYPGNFHARVTLRDLAAVYADRPGYREEWRP